MDPDFLQNLFLLIHRGGGDAFESYKFEKAIELANIVMKRRGVELDKLTIDIYKSFFK
ncbi:MAG: hypothetical protein ACJ0QS_01750 [Parvicellaceae bacterium]